jgi:hypothetical protein
MATHLVDWGAHHVVQLGTARRRICAVTMAYSAIPGSNSDRLGKIEPKHESSPARGYACPIRTGRWGGRIKGGSFLHDGDEVRCNATAKRAMNAHTGMCMQREGPGDGQQGGTKRETRPHESQNERCVTSTGTVAELGIYQNQSGGGLVGVEGGRLEAIERAYGWGWRT